jgi:hypothetical protein
MEQLFPCAFQEVPDGLLINAILKVGIDSTEGELLLCVVACLSIVGRRCHGSVRFCSDNAGS